uniref:Phage portal protein n=1 Tax=Schlesneria paludicola TaxID=360056 RepID=A0A7C4QPH5_9PLAN
MWQLLRDTWRTWTLRAQYQRLVQERVLALLASEGRSTVAEESPDWQLLGVGAGKLSAGRRSDLRQQARHLVQTNPYARNLLRLLEVYVVGPGLRVAAAPIDPEHRDPAVERACEQLWNEFLQANRRHFSLRETARRAWRDGECFIRLFPQAAWPATVRYVDPEAIGGVDAGEEDGIRSDPRDVETVRGYLRRNVVTGEVLEEIPASDMLHIKLGVDSNEPRGVSLFAPVLQSLEWFENWLETELLARKLQASIVLWRKVQGSPSQVLSLAERADGERGVGPGGTVRRERFRPGSILTTSSGTELEFLQPDTNFADAVPLGRLMLLGIAAGAGVPEFMLTADASNANFASTMIAEGPAVKLFESEQHFFAQELEPLWRWVLSQAAAHGLLPADVLAHVAPHWTFPQLVNRDRAKERAVDARLVEVQVLSRAEVARRDNADPAVMQAEIAAERTAGAVRETA